MFMSGLSFVLATAADYLLNNRKLTVTQVRKYSMTLSHLGMACGLFMLAFVGCNETLAVVALCISVASTAAIYTGFLVRM